MELASYLPLAFKILRWLLDFGKVCTLLCLGLSYGSLFLIFFRPKGCILHYLFVLSALPIASSLIYAPLSVAYSVPIP